MPSDSHTQLLDPALAKNDVPSTLLPLAAMLGSISSLAIGTSFGKHLFPILGAAGTTSLRTAIAAIILTAIWRPWRRPLSRRDAGAIVLYGVVLGTMNLCFYMAMRTIPLGIAVAIELSGPLAVALSASRRMIDVVWIGLAAVGLGLLLPLGQASVSLDPTGVAFALVAAVCWALYIICGQRVGRLHGGQVVALGMSAAALVVLPFGIATAGMALLDPSLLVSGLVVAVLSSALPYSLEMFALQRIPKQSFGVLLSLEPATGSIAAMAILGERLSVVEWIAIGCIVAASAGNTWSAHRRAPN